MFNKVLVAIPLGTATPSENSESQVVVEEAIALAKVHQSQLMLLHVMTPTDIFYPDIPYVGTPATVTDLYFDCWRQREAENLEKLKSLEEQAKLAGVSTEFTQAVGNPGTSICDFAKTWNADLILIGRRGLHGLNELFLGSVSNYVLHHAPCHVLTIQCAALAQPHQEKSAAAASST
jgi:nucleotide-binding universal stress UspA family protein